MNPPIIVEDATPPAAAAIPTSPTLGRSTATGFLWLLLPSLSGRLASFFSQLVLARLLMPEAFGQIGMAYTVTTLAGALISFGIDDVLLQRLRTFQMWASPAFWSSLALSLLGMVIMLAAAPFAGRLYHSPDLFGLVGILALTLPISALSTVPYVKLRASMDFRFLATYTSIEMVLIQVASIALAALGFGAFSFVLPAPVAAAVKAVVFWRKAPTRIRPRFRRKQMNHFVNSGFLVLGTRLIIEAVNQGDYIVLGLMATDTVLGVYFFAFRLAAQPLRMLAGNFGAVLFPAFTQLRAEPERQEAAALRASRMLAFIVTPVCFLQAALAAPALHLMFGARWNGAIPLVQILSVGLPGDAVAWVAGALLVARREFYRDFIYLCVFSPPFFVFVLIGAYLGSSLGVAIAVALYYALVKPINSWMVFRSSMGWRDFVEIYIAPPVITGAAIGAVYAISLVPALAARPIAQIATIVALSPLVYVALLRLLVAGILREILDRFPVDVLFWRFARRLTRRSA